MTAALRWALPPLLRHVIAGCAVLSILVVAGWGYGAWRLSGDELPAPVSPAVPSPAQAAAARLNSAAGMVDDPPEMVARPLLWQERVPPAPTVLEPKTEQASPQRSPVLDNATLTGVFLSGARSGITLRARGSSRRVFVGETLEGWRLESVDESSVIWRNLAGGGQRLVMELEHAAIASASK
jgi:hypothetical protein